MPWPLAGPEEIVAAFEEGLQGGARLAIVDHVFAPLAAVAPGAPAELFGAMVTLPLPVAEAGTEEAAKRWRKKLLDEQRIDRAHVFAICKWRIDFWPSPHP